MWGKWEDEWADGGGNGRMTESNWWMTESNWWMTESNWWMSGPHG